MKKIKTANPNKALRKDIETHLIAQLNGLAAQLGKGTKKLSKEIEKGAKKLAKKISKEITPIKVVETKVATAASAPVVAEKKPPVKAVVAAKPVKQKKVKTA